MYIPVSHRKLQQIGSWLTVLLLVFGVYSGIVAADSLGGFEGRSLLYNFPNYVPDSNSCEDVAAADVNLSGNDNIQKAFNFFVSQGGLTATQAAGIVGNFMQESGVNPHETNSLGYHGIAQWGGGRLDNLIQYANNHNSPEDALSTQLGFALKEMRDFGPYNQNTWPPLKAITGSGAADVNSAAEIIFSNYEIPGDSSLPARQNNAAAVLAKYGGQTGAAGSIASSITGGDCSSMVGNGQKTQFVDGFTVYDQCDPSWGTKSYGDTTICAAGCGPTSMAMIITNLTSESINPVQTAQYADGHGLYINGKGSSWSIGPAEAEHWGLKATSIGADVAKITAALQAGALIIAAGQGAEPFTTAGHFIVIRGVTPDGKWKIGDPDGAHIGASTKNWDPQQIVSEILADNGGSVYAISK